MHEDQPRTHSTRRESLIGRAARIGAVVFAVAALMIGQAGAPAGAQDVERFDPDEAYSATASTASSGQAQSGNTSAIDADLADPDLRASPPVAQPLPVQGDAQAVFDDAFPGYEQSASPTTATPVPDDAATAPQATSATYGEDDLIGAAEGVFGKGAQGLAGLIEDLLREQGEPNGYIVGREAGGAFVFGARYGSGTLYHKIEGQRPVYWTGPSLGLDAGANASNTFVLVYNLFDSEDIYRRYPAGEGQAYFVGGLHASYMRRGDVVLIPIRMGAGLRLGINAGYMRFSKKQRWLPF